MTITSNKIIINGYIGTNPEEVTTEKSSFIALSVGTSRGKTTDWHKVIVFSEGLATNVDVATLEKGDQVRIDGTLTYRKRVIKDGADKVIATVKEASVIASMVVLGKKKKQ